MARQHRLESGRQAGLKCSAADTGEVTLIQRFGSAANLCIHPHCLVFDGVYRRADGEPIFDQERASTGDEFKGLLDQIVARLMKILTRSGHLVEEQGITYLADTDAEDPLAPLQAASCTYRIALGPRAGQKVLSLRTGDGRDEKITHGLCADAHGFSLHAAVRCGADQRPELERLYRYITGPAIANERQLWSERYDRIESNADAHCVLRQCLSDPTLNRSTKPATHRPAQPAKAPEPAAP